MKTVREQVQAADPKAAVMSGEHFTCFFLELPQLAVGPAEK